MAQGGTGRALVSNQHHLRFHDKTALICITGSSQASELKGKQRQRCRCTWMRHLLTSLAHSALLQPTDERAHSSSSSSSRDALSAAHGDLIVPAVCRQSSTSTETILDQPKKKRKRKRSQTLKRHNNKPNRSSSAGKLLHVKLPAAALIR